MGWLDNLWRRRQGRTTDTTQDTVDAQQAQRPATDEEIADDLEEGAHRIRDEEIYREPRIPPGTG
jgi:hypothetical protein